MTIKRVLPLALAVACLAVPTAAAAAQRPAVTGLTFSPATFAVATSASASAAGRGTKIRLHLSGRGATINIAVARALGGRKVGGHCAKPTPKLRDRPGCTRHKHVGTMARESSGVGDQSLGFSGHLNGHALAPGKYRATIVAVDKRHHRSKRKRTTFSVTRAVGGAPKPAQCADGVDNDRDGKVDLADPGCTSPTDNDETDGAASPPTVTGDPNQFPNESTTGVPAGWVPAETRSTDLTVTQAGAVVQDVRFTNGAALIVRAPNVTVRRVKLEGGWINNISGGCANGLLLEDVTIDRSSPETNGGEGVVSTGGYTARRVAILNRSEGFRSGGASSGCGASTIQDSFIQIRPPDGCNDWHGDGIQGFGSSGLTVTNVTIDFNGTGCGGNAGFFYPGGPDGTPTARADINRLLIRGGGFSFFMGTPGSVQNLKIVNNAWGNGPINITDTGCGPISPWQAQIVTATASQLVTGTVRNLPCR
jgi:hypothetical protein